MQAIHLTRRKLGIALAVLVLGTVILANWWLLWGKDKIVQVDPWGLDAEVQEDVLEEAVEEIPEEFELPPLAHIHNASLSSTYYHQLPLAVPSVRKQHYLPTRLDDVPILTQPCLGEWLRTGTLDHGACKTIEETPVDFVWTWLNGSDPLWATNQKHYSQFEYIGRTQAVPARHYRNHGELQHSLRSIIKSYSGSIGQQHLVLGDWHSEGEEMMRVGQRPGWLKVGKGIKEVWHSEIWNSWNEEKQRRGLDEVITERNEYLRSGLPTFNSMAIESNLFNIKDLGPLVVYMNDDFFLMRPHSASDFHSPSSIYGPVMAFSFSETGVVWPEPIRQKKAGWSGFFSDEPRIPIQPGYVPPVRNIAVSCNHEWSALSRSSWLMAERFGKKYRPTLLHFSKPFLKGVMQESALIWKDEWKMSTKRRFREDGVHLPGDYHTSFLAQLLLVERSREAMLWTWAVVKMGHGSGIPGFWGRNQFLALREVLSLDERDPDFIPGVDQISSFIGYPTRRVREVTLRPDEKLRHTLGPEQLKKTFDAAGAEMPLSSTYGWTSLDGPLPPLGATIHDCTIDMDDCFSSWWRQSHVKGTEATMSAEQAFRRIAFEKPWCGDCMLSALTRHSGSLGISAILPDTSIKYVVQDKTIVKHAYEEQPHMPLTREWKRTDFSVKGVLGVGKWGRKVDLKDWCERLIGRYAWTAEANSTAHFAMLTSANIVQKTIDKYDANPPSIAAMNDDLVSASMLREHWRDADVAAGLFGGWLKKTWPNKAGWEVDEEQ